MTIFFTEISYSSTIIPEIKALYESAFPCDERRDFNTFIDFLNKGNGFKVRIGIDKETGSFLCFMSFWDFGDFCYIEHFAVVPEMRGHGIGKSAMHDFFAHTVSKTILEVEPPVDSITRRRVALYESLGFKIWNDIHYIQPPYAPHLNPIELKLMTRGDFSTADIEMAVKLMHSRVYSIID